ncbi:MAG: branched-chain amino acid aminotransferase [Alphaproteobacteria bacterium]
MRSIIYFEGRWSEGNPAVMGPMDQSFWMATQVFDGGRVFDGLAPDLDKHCARAVASARYMGMNPKESAEEVLDIALRTARRFDGACALYVRPTFWAEGGFMYPDPDATKFLMAVHESPMADPPAGFAACLSPFRRPDPRSAPTKAKASALYPTTGMAFAEAEARGFTNPVMLDHEGNVAEFAGSNLFIVKDGAVATPVPNDTFLNGITKARVIGLLAAEGVPVAERTIGFAEVADADEIFSTGNYQKVTPCTRIDGRDLQPGPVYRQARALYFQWAREKGLRV